VSRGFDIVLFGASGAARRRAAAYLTDRAPTTLRWAAAGRARSRLDELGLDVPLLVEDSRDTKQLDDLAGRTRLVLNMAGPFHLYGDPVVEACVRQNTHRCDISGETARIRDLIDRHHAVAAERQLKIVPFAAQVRCQSTLRFTSCRPSRWAETDSHAALRLNGGSFGEHTNASIGGRDFGRRRARGRSVPAWTWRSATRTGEA